MLDDDVTLRDLWKNGLLNDAREYLRRVFLQYQAIARDEAEGECTIRIGLTGTGHSPNYRIEPTSPPGGEVSREVLFGEKAPSDEGERARLQYLRNRLAIFSGRNHKRLSLNAGGKNWSKVAMSFDELQSLRAEVNASEHRSRLSSLKR